MQIMAIEPTLVRVNRRGDWLFLQVHTDAGLTGLGEASHSGNDALALAMAAWLQERVRGRDPRAINALWHELVSPNWGRVERTVLSGFEQALWDLLGQSLGVPIHALFGGALRKRIRLYANINRGVAERSPAGFAQAARQAVAEGFGAIKLAPFDELHAPEHVRSGPRAAWQPGVERVRAVRAAIGAEIELMVDCHSRMESSEAVLVARELADCRLTWFEEPVPQEQTAELHALRHAAGMAVASAESAFGMEGFAPFLCERAADVIMPDVKHDGGLTQTVHIAAAAQMRQVLVAPHNPAGPVATAATAQVAATFSNLMILEYAWGEAPWRAVLLDPPERIEEGHLLLPAGAGLGHRLAPDAVAAHLAPSALDQDTSKVRPR